LIDQLQNLKHYFALDWSISIFEVVEEQNILSVSDLEKHFQAVI